MKADKSIPNEIQELMIVGDEELLRAVSMESKDMLSNTAFRSKNMPRNSFFSLNAILILLSNSGGRVLCLCHF